MNMPDWLTQESDGNIHLTDHRVSLEDVVHFYVQGDSPEMLHCRFPTISLATFHKAIAFYLENQDQVDKYCAAAAATVAAERAKPQPGPTVEEMRQRREAKRLAQGA